ncbi:MAG TPA: bifunctional [glutamine synthetase] adenylyltransferase/[glutamine synthetase]-adenylyl-L-tyrosine phosphorylase, partial [Pseudonocardiaceae bacterium]|nr:bifunctional [glutamine synthetase] adenylyltransferase/[glutamine synthetase]-adenylyl-L-tyrosine phosphorylase [Pseudonocardiaceae bacterium]
MAGDRRGSVASPARLGLTDPAATDVLTQLGWWRDGSPVAEVTGVLWALSRSPAPDLALRALQRLADAMGGGWAELDGAVRRDAGLRGRLLGVLGGSVALGDHLVADPGRWRRLTRSAGAIGGRAWTRRIREGLLTVVGADPQEPPPGTPGGARARLTGTQAQRALRAGYLDMILDVAAADLAAVVEPGLPVLAFEDVGAALAELAAAALAAALAVA